MKYWQKIVWNVSLTILAFLIIYGLFVMILGGFFVVFEVQYDTFPIFILFATIFFIIRFVTDELFNQTSKRAVENVQSVQLAVLIQLFISTVLHFIIIYSLHWIITGVYVPLAIQVILAFGCSFAEVVLNGKWKSKDREEEKKDEE